MLYGEAYKQAFVNIKKMTYFEKEYNQNHSTQQQGHSGRFCWQVPLGMLGMEKVIISRIFSKLWSVIFLVALLLFIPICFVFLFAFFLIIQENWPFISNAFSSIYNWAGGQPIFMQVAIGISLILIIAPACLFIGALIIGQMFEKILQNLKAYQKKFRFHLYNIRGKNIENS